MAPDDQDSALRGSSPRAFLTTRWSVVRAARSTDVGAARAALADLCQSYWLPLYGYVRRRGHQREEARDLTQAFFARLLEKRDFDAANPDVGRFHAGDAHLELTGSSTEDQGVGRGARRGEGGGDLWRRGLKRQDESCGESEHSLVAVGGRIGRKLAG